MNANEPIILHVSLNKGDFHKICRFCLTETEEVLLVNLYRVKYEEKFIKDLIEQLFGDKIMPSHELPQNMCQNCIGEIVRCYNFKKTYDTSNLILKALVLSNITNIKECSRELCIDDIKTSSSNVEEDRDELCFEEIKLEYEEIVDEANIVNNEPLQTSLADQCEISLIEDYKHDSIEETIEDVVAGNFTQELNINHKPDTRNSHRTEIEETIEDVVAGNFTQELNINHKTDPAIKEIISREDDIDNNKVPNDPRVVEARQYRCECNEIFQLESEFIQHKKEKKHKSARSKYFCKLCKRFFIISSYIIHLHSHNKEKAFVCEICSKRFISRANQRRHVRTKHKRERAFVCEICGKSFGALFSLKVHKRIHTGEKPYLCDICGKRYKHKRCLALHRRERDKRRYVTVENADQCEGPREKVIPCDQCPKLFASTSGLQAHMVTHGPKKFSCEYCDKACYTKLGLQSHLTTHTGAKPFSCDVCSKRFAGVNSLDRHKRMHSGVKPYICYLCHKSFRQSAHLYRHIRNIHKEKQPYFVCEFCSKCFADSWDLRMHVRIHKRE